MTKAFSPRDMQSLAHWVMQNGETVVSERGKTSEIVGASLVLNNPLNRLDTHRYRKLNLGFAIAEWLAMLNGENRLPFFTKFVSRYKDYSSDGVAVDGAYGPRLRVVTGKSYSVIDQVVMMLSKTPESRRAVVTIYDNIDLFGAGGLNTPCTVSMQFLIRKNKLHMLTYMRSNDIHYGLTNDVIVFTLTQELIARQLGVELGPYHHFAGSLHVYHEEMKKFMAKEMSSKEGRWPHSMLPMPKNYHDSEVKALYHAYDQLQPGLSTMRLAEIIDPFREQYTFDLFAAGAMVVLRNGTPDHASYLLSRISDPTIKRISNFWVVKETK